MQNPEVSREPTPNGGDYAEMWYLDNDGNAVDDMSAATKFKIIEKTNGDATVFETYGFIRKDGE